MKISEQNISELTKSLNDKLGKMLAYQQATVDLLNCEIEQASVFLNKRQGLIDEVNAIDIKINQLLITSEDVALTEISRALKGYEVQLHDERFRGALTVAKRIRAVIKDITIIDKKLLTKTEKMRAEMIEELKNSSGQRKVVDTLYFSTKTGEIGSTYDLKK